MFTTLVFVSPNSFSIIEYNLGGEVNHLSSDKVHKKEPDQDFKKRKQYIPTVWCKSEKQTGEGKESPIRIVDLKMMDDVYLSLCRGENNLLEA